MKLLSFATITIISLVQMAQAERACVTVDECKGRSEEYGIADFYVGDFPTKGCFTKNNKVFFSKGTEEEMSSTDLVGEQKRIWCGDSSNDLVPYDQLLPTSASGMPSLRIMVALASCASVVASITL